MLASVVMLSALPMLGVSPDSMRATLRDAAKKGRAAVEKQIESYKKQKVSPVEIAKAVYAAQQLKVVPQDQKNTLKAAAIAKVKEAYEGIPAIQRVTIEDEIKVLKDKVAKFKTKKAEFADRLKKFQDEVNKIKPNEAPKDELKDDLNNLIKDIAKKSEKDEQKKLNEDIKIIKDKEKKAEDKLSEKSESESEEGEGSGEEEEDTPLELYNKALADAKTNLEAFDFANNFTKADYENAWTDEENKVLALNDAAGIKKEAAVKAMEGIAQKAMTNYVNNTLVSAVANYTEKDLNTLEFNLGVWKWDELTKAIAARREALNKEPAKKPVLKPEVKKPELGEDIEIEEKIELKVDFSTAENVVKNASKITSVDDVKGKTYTSEQIKNIKDDLKITDKDVKDSVIKELEASEAI